eukprot:gene2838-3461_t
MILSTVADETDHLSKIANKLAPIPGSQLAVEKRHEEALQAYAKLKDTDRSLRQQRLDVKLQVKQQSARLNTEVYFQTVFNQKIDQIEAILREKESLLAHDPREKIKQRSKHDHDDNEDGDTGEEEEEEKYKQEEEEEDDPTKETQIAKFREEVVKGRPHYISYAISHGFAYINYQEAASMGNSFLHLACRRGHVEVVEKLLQHKAQPDVKNDLGNYPIHECWLFWEMDTTRRTREKRLEQEKRTCRLLLALLSYGAFVDAADLNGQTALHIACRLGPIQAVKILLTFQANTELRIRSVIVEGEEEEGQTAEDIAREFAQDEAVRLINGWAGIRAYLIHSDFHTVWKKFLEDYEASMAMTKPAAQVLSEMALEGQAKHMARLGQSHQVYLDDPLLVQALQASRALEVQGVKAPKPWERDWKKFVKASRAAGVMDLKAKLDALQASRGASR